MGRSGSWLTSCKCNSLPRPREKIICILNIIQIVFLYHWGNKVRFKATDPELAEASGGFQLGSQYIKDPIVVASWDFSCIYHFFWDWSLSYELIQTVGSQGRNVIAYSVITVLGYSTCLGSLHVPICSKPHKTNQACAAHTAVCQTPYGWLRGRPCALS